ncbi:hypothetical protein MMC11_000769 [Xylographa trunciseda]|nr:hypothetical protein [Xylographa trunciseda]
MSTPVITTAAQCKGHLDVQTKEISETSSLSEERPQCLPPTVHVDLTKPHEPAVKFVLRSQFLAQVAATVLARTMQDVLSSNWYRPQLASDALVHYYYYPMGIQIPRVVSTAPHPRMKMKVVPSTAIRQNKGLQDLSIYPEREVINCGSSNYGGFSYMDPGTVEILETAVRRHSLALAPKHLQDTLRSEFTSYMGFDEAAISPTGFTANIVAFATVAAVAKSQRRSVVFFCDTDSHSSMLTGAYMCEGAKVQKFRHNDLTDLDFKLRRYREQAPGVLICVAIEGVYSMEGSFSPGPAIIALKKIYNFCLLVDEAHSFMAVGSEGKGSFNHWQDLGYHCPLTEIDVMTCTFSKSVGCAGGVAIANGIFAEQLRKGDPSLDKDHSEPLSAIVILRVLDILRRPLLIQHRMKLLREKASYVSGKLAEAGFKILSSPGSSTICFPVGTVTQLTSLNREALKIGLAFVGGVPPATPLWGCRVRLCIPATISWPDIHRMLDIMNVVCVKLKVPGVKQIRVDSEKLYTGNGTEGTDILAETKMAYCCMMRDLDSIEPALPMETCLSKIEEDDVRSVGIQALKRYGVGPFSPRWFYGLFDVFVALETKIATLYPSLVQQAGHVRALISSDAQLMISSALGALVGQPASRSVLHVILVPTNASQAVNRAVRLCRPHTQVVVHRYNNIHDIQDLATNLPARKLQVTIYVPTLQAGKPLAPEVLASSLSALTTSRRRISQCTVLLDDSHGMGKLGPRRLGYLDHVESVSGPAFLTNTLARVSRRVTILVAGSWYEAFAHQGGYLVGPSTAVETLSYTAKSVFFSTPPLPLQAAMTLKTLEILSSRARA